MKKISIFIAIIVLVIFSNLVNASAIFNNNGGVDLKFSGNFNLLDLNINKSYSSFKGNLLTSEAVEIKNVTVNFSPGECELLAFNDWHYIKVGNLTSYTKPGDPQLPMKTLVVKLPKNSEILDVSLISGSYREILNNLNIIPAPEPQKLNANGSANKESRNLNVYNSISYFPGKIFSYDTGEDNENSYLLIRFYPVQYMPLEKKAILITNAEIEIYYIYHKTRDKQLSLFSLSEEAVIITSQELKTQADNLAAFHNATGTQTAVVTTQYIWNNYNATTDPGYEGYKDSFLFRRNNITSYNYTLAKKIVSFLNESSNIKYVILFGNARIVPPSYYIYDEQTNCGWCNLEECVIDYYNSWIPTDYFYGSPDYDLIPNHMVGRIPVNNASEASHFVQKINNWSSNLNWSWFKNVAVAGGRPFMDTMCGTGNYDAVFSGEMSSTDIIDKGYFSGMNITKLFRSDDKFNKSNMKDVLSGGYGMAYHDDHGSGDALSTSNDQLNTSDIINMSANSKVPIVVSSSCMNGAYDSYIIPNDYYGYVQSMSIGESILNSNAGGIAYIGGSRTTYGAPTAYLKNGYVQSMKEYYMSEMGLNIFKSYHEGSDSLGGLTKSAIFQYVVDNDFYDNPTNKRTLFEFVLLGDPALKIPIQQSGEYSEKPKLNAVNPSDNRDSYFFAYGDVPTYSSGSNVIVTCQADSPTVKMKLISVDDWFNETKDIQDVNVIGGNANYTFAVNDTHLYLVRCIDNNGKEGWLYVNQPFAVFTDSYSSQGVDIDSDNKSDYLSIDIYVNVKKAGGYIIGGVLCDKTLTFCTEAQSIVNLSPVVQAVELNFDGHEIYKKKMSGNYQLMDLSIKDYWYMQLDYRYNPYSTPIHNYTEFEPEVSKTAYITGSYSDSGIDTNTNGKYEYLTISINVNVMKAGTYRIYGELYDDEDNYIVSADNSLYLDEGTQTMELDFDGRWINYNGVSGNYNLAGVDLYDENENEIDYKFDVYNTSYYYYYQFEPFQNIFTGNYSSSIIDTNGNGKYDYLALDATISIPSEGYYGIGATLYDSRFHEIDSAVAVDNLTLGMHTIQLNFSGWKIYSNGADGPYMVFGLSILNENLTTLDFEVNPHNTSPYNYTSFESLPRKILLVDDDQDCDGDMCTDYEDDYKNSLDVNGYSYKYWDVYYYGSPNLSTLSLYDVVIWFTGDDWSNTLSTQDQDNLKNYLDSGGKLFISGQDIGYDIGATSFYQNYLHAEYEEDDKDTTEIGGIFGDFISNELDINQYGDYPDVISVKNDAVKIFDYVGGSYSLYPAAGLRYSGKYRVVYLPFGFEFASNQDILMDRIVKWLLQPTTFKSYASYGEDTDGDGLYNYLVINVTLNITKTGNYSIGGGLYDQNLNFIGYSEIHKYLSIGMQTVQLKFDGYKIYNNGISSDYQLKFLYIENIDTGYSYYPLDYAIDPCNTSYYSHTSFDRAFTGNYGESAEKIYEEEGIQYIYLTINVSVNITSDGYYIVSGELYNNNESFITKTGNLTYLNSGIQTVKLNFRGFDIYRNEVDGQYYLENLYIKDIKGNILDYKESAYNTSSYNHENFKCNCLDNDSDGYGVYPACNITNCCRYDGNDCDDVNSGIHPGAADIPNNGIDENCAGGDNKTYYRDADNDNYGNATNNITLDGGTLSGYVANNTDCNDANLSIHPGAPEICNGIDDNCDNRIDEENASGCNIYYADIDGDGYGSTSNGKCLCTPSAAYNTTNNIDCDDNNASIIPAFDNLNVNRSLTICINFYNINDTAAPNGVIIINASNVVLDCINATLNGNGNGYGIYNPGFDNVTIKNCKVINYAYGVYIENSNSSKLLYNKILNNVIGIYSRNSNSNINSNTVCGNTNLDFNSSDWLSSSGNDNVCDNPDRWNDTGITGCWYTCSGLPRVCDLNHEGIIVHDYNDLMTAYKCFLGIENCGKIQFRDWQKIEEEYRCFAGAPK